MYSDSGHADLAMPSWQDSKTVASAFILDDSCKWTVRSTQTCEEVIHRFVNEWQREMRYAPVRGGAGTCLHTSENHCAAVSWVEGTILEDRIQCSEEAGQLGSLLGRLHTSILKSAKELPRDRQVARLANQAGHEYAGALDIHPEYRERREHQLLRLNPQDLEHAINAHVYDRRPAHGDVWPANLVRTNDGLVLIDWERARSHGAWYEALRALIWTVGERPWYYLNTSLWESFLSGYVAQGAYASGPPPVKHYLTLALADSYPYTATMRARYPDFARDRLDMVDWLINSHKEVQQLMTSRGKR